MYNLRSHRSSHRKTQISSSRRVKSYPVYEDTWMKDESHHAVADVGGPVGSDRSGSSDGFKPSPKLRARIEKLAKWRINPADISLGNGSEYHGGHASVLEGILERRTKWSRQVRDVAVKKMRLADDTDFERVLGLTIREAEFLAELGHKNVVELEGFVEDVSKGIIWLVFPWAKYGNLKDFIAREKWDIPERISLISDVAKGLAYLHTRNPPICHGDLKSLNVLIYEGPDDYRGWVWSRSGGRKTYARITDFGSARRLPQRDPDTQVEPMVTQLPSTQPPSAAFCGSTKTITLTGNKYTLRWAAPELLLQDQLSLWSDIWALGWICYEVMTGSLPFEDALSEMAVVTRVLEGQLPSLTDNAHLSLIHELCSLMNMCWEAKPSQRPTADSCRRSIEKMPMFAPEMKDDQRVLDYHHLRQLGQMYQSRGEYARAFTFFVTSATGRFQLDYRVQGLRDLAQLARLTEEYSETIAVYNVIWAIYEDNAVKDMDGLSDAFCDLAELHRLRNESKRTGELHYEGRDIQGQQRVAKALCAMAEDHRLGGHQEKATLVNTSALKISTDLGDRKGIADALWGLAEVHWSRSEHEQAIQLYSEVSKIRTDLGDRKGRADVLWDIAEVHRDRSEYEEAILFYSEVVKIRADIGDEQGRAEALLPLADVHRRRSEYEEASRLYSEVLDIRNDFRDTKIKPDALGGLAEMHRLRSDYDEAILLYSELLEICTDLDDSKGRASALCGLADVHGDRGEYEEAIRLYSEVKKIRTDIGNEQGRASALWGLAEMHRLRSEYRKAITLYSKVVNIRTDIGDEQGRADALLPLADVHRRRSEYEEASRLYSEVLEIRTNFGDKKGRADALWGLAEMHRLRSEYDEAIPLYSELLEICTDLDGSKGRASALWGLAEVHRLRREDDEAIPLYFKALGIFTEIGDRQGKAGALLGLAGMQYDQRDDGDDVYQQVAEILKPSRTLADPTSDDEWLVRLRIRVLNWLVRRLGSLASDLTKGLPAETASEAWVSVQEVHEDERPSKRFKQS